MKSKYKKIKIFVVAIIFLIISNNCLIFADDTTGQTEACPQGALRPVCMFAKCTMGCSCKDMDDPDDFKNCNDCISRCACITHGAQCNGFRSNSILSGNNVTPNNLKETCRNLLDTAPTELDIIDISICLNIDPNICRRLNPPAQCALLCPESFGSPLSNTTLISEMLRVFGQEIRCPCESGEECNDGQKCCPGNPGSCVDESNDCRESCNNDEDCVGSFCIEGICTEPQSCDGDGECPEGFKCKNGKCDREDDPDDDPGSPTPSPSENASPTKSGSPIVTPSPTDSASPGTSPTDSSSPKESPTESGSPGSSPHSSVAASPKASPGASSNPSPGASSPPVSPSVSSTPLRRQSSASPSPTPGSDDCPDGMYKCGEFCIKNNLPCNKLCKNCPVGYGFCCNGTCSPKPCDGQEECGGVKMGFCPDGLECCNQSNKAQNYACVPKGACESSYYYCGGNNYGKCPNEQTCCKGSTEYYCAVDCDGNHYWPPPSPEPSVCVPCKGVDIFDPGNPANETCHADPLMESFGFGHNCTAKKC